MSGDLGAEVVVQAVVESLKKYRSVEFALVGDESVLQPMVRRWLRDDARVQIVHASEVVTMTDAPADAVRKKKDSSMRVAIDLVKSGDAQACVSAGNTGALMATSKFVLKMLPGIDRPAIIAELPSFSGSLHMLDLGANTQCSPDQLFQFAVMGSIVASDVAGIASPRIALLNIGIEAAKGSETIREAAALIDASTLNYVGFIEGSDVFRGKADVIVTDGFTGNVALKSMEGTVVLAKDYLLRAFTQDWLSKLQAVFARSVLKRISSELDSRNYNGATLVGLSGIVIKSHGGADAYAFGHAIDTAIVEVRNQLPQQIGELLQREAA